MATKSYIEVAYKGAIFGELVSQEVSTRDPLKVDTDILMEGFRFYDVLNPDNKHLFKVNYSNWYYFGTKMSLDDLEYIYGSQMDFKLLIEPLRKKGYNYVCHTNCGSYIPMTDDDMLYSEYVDSLRDSKVNSIITDMKLKYNKKYELLNNGPLLQRKK